MMILPVSFIKKYLRVAKYCGDTNSDCFADKYYEYKDNKKEEYTPTYKGGCARLKNGMSICITPQIGARSIEGLLDINGKKGPNVFGRDLRSFYNRCQNSNRQSEWFNRGFGA